VAAALAGPGRRSSNRLRAARLPTTTTRPPPPGAGAGPASVGPCCSHLLSLSRPPAAGARRSTARARVRRRLAGMQACVRAPLLLDTLQHSRTRATPGHVAVKPNAFLLLLLLLGVVAGQPAFGVCVWQLERGRAREKAVRETPAALGNTRPRAPHDAPTPPRALRRAPRSPTARDCRRARQPHRSNSRPADVSAGSGPGDAMVGTELQPKATYRPKSKLEVFYTGGAAVVTKDGKHIACACSDEVKVGAAMGPPQGGRAPRWARLPPRRARAALPDARLTRPEPPRRDPGRGAGDRRGRPHHPRGAPLRGAAAARMRRSRPHTRAALPRRASTPSRWPAARRIPSPSPRWPSARTAARWSPPRAA
jgi:hypothetical protein